MSINRFCINFMGHLSLSVASSRTADVLSPDFGTPVPLGTVARYLATTSAVAAFPDSREVRCHSQNKLLLTNLSAPIK